MFLHKIVLSWVIVLAYAIPGVTQNSRKILSKAEERIEQYRKGECSIMLIDDSEQAIAPGIKVKIEQTRHAFLFGCNIFWLFNPDRPIKENEKNMAQSYAQYFSDLFNFATLPFYWASYEPEEGRPKKTTIEKAIAWCEQHQITMKGHTLAWNGAKEPSYLEKLTPKEAMQKQMHRVSECVKTFQNKIDIWDVVNEATTYDRESNEKISPKLTHAIREVGVKTYLQESFHAARKENPNALLIINDYVQSDTYRERVLNQMIVDKQPVFDAIGIQAHQQRGSMAPFELWGICNRFAKYKVPLHFTEISFVSGSENVDYYKNNQHGKWASNQNGETRQAQDVVQFYTVLFSHPAVEAITWWDFSDDRSWLGAPSGLLRADMSPKPAYYALKKLIKEKWWTTTTVNVQSDNTVQFRGFYGDYKVTVLQNGNEITGTFRHDKNQTGVIQVKLK